ncbi:RNA polymerase sigma factor [Parapedobacter indicus]|uniref:RNA polymerase sigma-70 factor, ECF subfamily n=1 Tax=Parapedobacter indicus TaxID=1477437 RepID=A0A1I3T7G2_9SPHI|nr:RNA polymerase sigma-70 factor [Parapedobacter indicus]PPK99622.1 RNA polymerase sigma-70 factor (ECF subfamily) [Parapedobacter indicus]SFJ66229.1 RNA polymerase sigma-70 factor, ECF subfamily [Parapedobacter indicus]
MAINYWELEDEELIPLIKAGDDNAFSLLYVRYSNLLFRHALSMLKDEEEAKDAIQDVFTALWEKHEELEIRGSVSGYLYIATRHAVLKILQNGKRSEEFIATLIRISETQESTADAEVQVKELAAIIEAEVAKLPRKMREVFLLSRKHHLTHREIAQKLNLSEYTVKRQTSNALTILRKTLGNLVSIMMHLI